MTRVERPRVVIVGGGFGGLSCAKELDGKPADVVLVDRRNYFLFTPLLYQVATALLTAPDIARPFRAIFRGSSNIRFLQRHVTGIDLERKLLRTSRGDELAYDYLVLATGSTDDYFGNQALAERTIGLKSLGVAQSLRNHVLTCLELAAQSGDETERHALLTFVVVGAGPTGVEYAGALAELLRLVLGRDYPELRPDSATIVLVEGRGQVLPAFAPKLGAYAARVLGRRGVDVETGALVTEATASEVTLSTGRRIETRTVVWSAGVRPDDPTGSLELPRSRTNRIVVDDHLRLAGADGVFVIGDLASVEDEGAELPMVSPPAMQEGRYAARRIVAEARGETGGGRAFRYRDKGTMATVGRNAAVASLGRLELRGFAGWVMWLTVHLYYLVGFRNRFFVFASWGFNYIRKDRPIRLINPAEPDPLTETLLDELAGPRETGA